MSCNRMCCQIFNRFVRQRAIINSENGSSLPPRFVQSQLLESMVKAAASGETGVVVVHAGRGTGKSAAAKFVLKNSAGGIMFCHMKGPYYGCYWKGVANALEIPEDCFGEEWQDLLVSSVAAATDASPPVTRSGLKKWTTFRIMDGIMDGLLSMCGGGTQETAAETLPPTIDGLDVTRVQNTPIIVFDDFNNVADADFVFI